VAEFPYFTAAADRHRHTEYMLASTIHWQPLINGSSDHTPQAAFADGLVLEGFPSEQAWSVLRKRGARYVVMHWGDYPARANPREVLYRDFVGRSLRTVVDRPQASLFEIVSWPTGDSPGAPKQ
jgi:hypothetical protein